MSEDFVNNYAPTPEPPLSESDLYGSTPYDLNFAYPLLPETLQTPRLKLVPFVPAAFPPTPTPIPILALRVA